MKPNASRRKRGFTLVELLVVIGIIALLISILLPALNKVREEAQKTKCAANLTQIFAAMQAYANLSPKGDYPRTYWAYTPSTYAPIGSIDCTNGGGPVVGSTTQYPNSFTTPVLNNSVTASIFLLMKQTQYPPEIFVCPSSNANPGFKTGNFAVKDYSNFEDTPLWGQTMSYSFQCMFPSQKAYVTYGFQWNASAISTGFPIAADLNPGVTGGNNPINNVTNITHSSSSRDMAQGNSNNHKNKGQNVLFGDKSVSWQLTPFCGPTITTAAVPFNDNIYTARMDNTSDEHGELGPTNYPFDNLDAYLLPTDDNGTTQGFY